MQSHLPTVGGSDFLRVDCADADVFTPEDFSEEQRMIRELASRFVREEVFPEQDKIERQHWETTVHLLRRSAELGLVGVEIPEGYGGAGLDRVSAMIVAEEMARVPSFSVSFGGVSGIGTLPLLYFGNEELRKAYLPRVCSGELMSAYALSEASSGSDALSARTRATRSLDNSNWILNGEKMWVTNAAFADIFITFAQIDGNKFSCFLVRRDFPGVSVGAEESKMGLKGSSTRPLVLTDVPVPDLNRIGDAGRGHEVAFNILNIGRTKLGANAVGLGKTAFNDAVRYAKQRVAFGAAISSFGAIQHKLAEMAIRIWIAESIVYRTAQLMDRRLDGIRIDDRPQLIPALKEYAVECSLAKVFGSEMLDYVVDETVQIFGGYGFSAEYPVERYYRDARVFRIFEGTNEINRLMIAGMLLKSLRPPAPAQEHSVLNEARALFYFVAAESARVSQLAQEIQTMLADMALEIYAIDSGMHRAGKMRDAGNAAAAIAEAMVTTYVNDAVPRIRQNAQQILVALNSIANAPTLEWSPIDTVSTRRRIAEYVLN